MATTWAAGLAGVTASIGEGVLGAQPRGLALGAVVCGVLAVALTWTEVMREEPESVYS